MHKQACKGQLCKVLTLVGEKGGGGLASFFIPVQNKWSGNANLGSFWQGKSEFMLRVLNK